MKRSVTVAFGIGLVTGGLIILDFLRVDGRSHSNSDTLINFVPDTLALLAIALVTVYFIQSRNRPKKK
jgi:hypothetical protein